MGHNVNYRKVKIEDENNLYPLAKSLATSFEVNREDFSAVFHQLLKDANADLLVAEKEYELIGYVFVLHHPAFYANGIISWVEELFVLEQYRAQNIGRFLMENAEEVARTRGSKLMALATRRADKFYKAIGYNESATYFKKNLV